MASVPARAYHVMTKPIGPICSLDCKYCFYLEKEKFFPSNENFRMSDEVLETYIRQYIEEQQVPEFSFAWQGGEPTLMGINFFRKVVELQCKYAGGKVISNALQTIGTLLNDESGEFPAANAFRVGLSIDGPAKLHDTYCITKKTVLFIEVIAGLQILKKHRVEFNALTVVNRVNSRKPLEVYRFLRDIGSGFIQFIPLVERLANSEAKELGLDLATPPRSDKEGHFRLPVTDWSVEPHAYGEFLCSIFDEWVKRDVGKTFVCNSPISAMFNSEFQRQFGQDKRGNLPSYCCKCDVRHLCHRECPKHRFLRTPGGESGLNYLCAAYKRFFRHSAPAMKDMARLIHSGRPAADIMLNR